ncbi:hypothetical protein ACFE04_025024 [Oxalis oulophora]
MAFTFTAVEEQGTTDFTKDGTVDLRGNPIRRSQKGGWKACSFLVVYEVFERMAYYGISTNLVIYMTEELHQGTVKSSNNVTNWVGTIWLAPILGAYIADAHLGRFWTFIIASIIYLMGMALLTLSVSLPGLRPPPCHTANVETCKTASTLQLAVFFGALYTLAVGTGGTKPNISTIGADQFDEFHPRERLHKFSFFNWWTFAIFVGTLFANTILVYLQDNVGWSIGYGIPTIGLLISILIFLAGTPFYRHKLPAGSPFTRMVKVFVAAIRKWNVPLPKDPKDLYDLDPEEYTANAKFLNKASVKTGSTDPWMLCAITQVEETKQMLRMIPVLIATFVPGTMLAQVNTLFVKQGTTLNRKIGSFHIPPAGLSTFETISILISLVLYDRYFVRIMRRWTKIPRGITLLQRMGIGLVFHIAVMITAALVDHYRLIEARKHNVVDNGGHIPVTIFILLPQFVLMGVASAFLEVAKLEFFYDQAPESMKSLGTSYSFTSIGVGNFISSFLLSTVSHITKKNGHQGWISNNLNASRLDYYYGFFVILNFLNFLFFLVVIKFYVYKAEVSDSTEVLAEELKTMPLSAPTTD